MKKIKTFLLLLGVSLSLAAQPVGAQGVWEVCKSGVNTDSAICVDAKKNTEASNIVTRLINTFLFVIGILSVVMIIHSGFKYVNSRGDAEGVKSAKNTLLYAVTGLIVALLAFVIVNFVVGIFLNSGTTSLQPSTLSTGGIG